MQRAYYCTAQSCVAFAKQEYEEGCEWVIEASANTTLAVAAWTGVDYAELMGLDWFGWLHEDDDECLHGNGTKDECHYCRFGKALMDGPERVYGSDE